MKPILILTLFSLSLGMGQETLRIRGTGEFIKFFQDSAMNYHFSSESNPTIFVDGKRVYPYDCLSELVAKWREYETWCAESVYVPTGTVSVDRERMKREPPNNRYWFWTKPDSAWRQRRAYPLMDSGFIRWLEGKK